MITKKMAGMKQVLLWMIIFGLLILTILFLERLRLFNKSEIYDAYPLPVVSETLQVIPVDLSIPEGAELAITASPVPTRSPYPTPSAPQETNSTLFPTAIAPNDASGVIIVFQLQEGDVPVLRVIPVNGTGNVDEFKDERIIPIVTTPEFEELLPLVKYCDFIVSHNGLTAVFFDRMENHICPNYFLELGTGLLTPISLPGITDIYEWHPDNQHLLINEAYQYLELFDIRSGGRRMITQISYNDISYASISPDGMWIAYSGFTIRDGRYALNTIDSWGRNHSLLKEEIAKVTQMRWSPDGKQLAFYADGWKLINSDGSNLREIKDGFSVNYMSKPLALWSPDSRFVIYTSQKYPSIEAPIWSEDRLSLTKTVVVNSASGAIQTISGGSTQLLNPIWSPDGNLIAFISNQSGASEVWVINNEGENFHILSEDGSPKMLFGWYSNCAQ